MDDDHHFHIWLVVRSVHECMVQVSGQKCRSDVDSSGNQLNEEIDRTMRKMTSESPYP